MFFKSKDNLGIIFIFNYFDLLFNEKKHAHHIKLDFSHKHITIPDFSKATFSMWIWKYLNGTRLVVLPCNVIWGKGPQQ